MPTTNGIFSISLDFELHWGIFDNIALSGRKKYFDNTRKSIPKTLDLFEKNEIAVTWAIVGKLFHKDLEAIREGVPKLLPSYENARLSAYSFMENSINSDDKSYYTAPELVKTIKSTSFQEIGTHTYSHYYTLAKGQTKDQFRSDLSKCIEVAKSYDLTIESIVFPRNQINKEYLEVCKSLGIVNIRVNPQQWLWSGNGKYRLIKKVLRTVDCYLPLFKSTVSLSSNLSFDNELLLFPASRFLKPISSIPILNYLRLKRIMSEMTSAAKKREYYHLWWHPHNFGNNPRKALKELEIIIKHFLFLKKKYKMESLSMSDTRKKLIGNG